MWLSTNKIFNCLQHYFYFAVDPESWGYQLSMVPNNAVIHNKPMRLVSTFKNHFKIHLFPVPVVTACNSLYAGKFVWLTDFQAFSGVDLCAAVFAGDMQPHACVQCYSQSPHDSDVHPTRSSLSELQGRNCQRNTSHSDAEFRLGE